MSAIRAFALGAFVLLSGLAQAAQESGVSLSDLSVTIRRWGADAGLPSGRADAVVQTPDGFLWVATSEGLYRFDGRKFVQFPTKSVPEIGHHWITRICMDRDGALWLLAANGRVARFADGRFFAVRKPEEKAELLRWAAHPDGGIAAVFKMGNAQFVAARVTSAGTEILSEPFQPEPLAIHVSKDGRFWISQRRGVLVELRDRALQQAGPDPNPAIGYFVDTGDGAVLGLGRSAIYRLANGAWSQAAGYAAQLSRPPTYAVADSDDRVWFGAAATGNFVWDGEGPVQPVRGGRGSLPDVILTAMRDETGGLWFSSFTGLYQVRYAPFVAWPPPAAMQAGWAISVRPKADGSVWFSGFGGVCRLAPGAAEPELMIARPVADVTLFDVAPDGAVWFVNKDAYAARWQPSRQSRIPVEKQTPEFTPTGVVIDREGAAWIASYAGLFRCDPNVQPQKFGLASGADGLPKGAYQFVQLLPDGTLAVMARGNGVFVRRAGGKSWERQPDSGVKWTSRINLIEQDAEARVWAVAAVDDGIGCWSDGAFFHGSLESLGLGGVRVSGIAAGDNDGLWFATLSSGAARVSRNALLDWLRHPGGKAPTLDWFDAMSGLPSRGLSFATESIVRGPDGRIWVGSEGGLSVIDPKRWRAERERAPLPRVRIGDCIADGVAIKTERGAEIPAGTARFEIGFSSSSIGLPGEIKLRYRMRGLDDGWTEAGLDETAHFLRVRPGSYRFEVMAANRYGSWNPEPAMLAVTVAPFWWQTKIAWIAGAAVLLVVMLAVFRLRLASLRRREAMQARFSSELIASQEDERRRIAAELHDSLGQSLLVVKNLASLGRQSHAGDTETSEQFGEIRESAAQALEEVRAISRALRPPELDRLGITKAIRAMLDRVADSSGIEIDADVDDLEGSVPAEHEIGIFRILQEALNNVLKHAAAKSVRVSAKREPSLVRLTIADDGRGIAPAAGKSAGGVGLTSMRERARLMGGSLEIRPSSGSGTLVELVIPISAANARG